MVVCAQPVKMEKVVDCEADKVGIDTLVAGSLLGDFLFEGLLVCDGFSIEDGLDAALANMDAGEGFGALGLGPGEEVWGELWVGRHLGLVSVFRSIFGGGLVGRVSETWGRVTV